MNGRYQVGSGRVVTITHDTPFIENIVADEDVGVKGRDTAYLDAVNRGGGSSNGNAGRA